MKPYNIVVTTVMPGKHASRSFVPMFSADTISCIITWRSRNNIAIISPLVDVSLWGKGSTNWQITVLPIETRPPRSVTLWFVSAAIWFLPWLGNAPHLNPIENTWQHIKDKVDAKQPSLVSELIETIKHARVFEISREYCGYLSCCIRRHTES